MSHQSGVSGPLSEASFGLMIVFAESSCCLCGQSAFDLLRVESESGKNVGRLDKALTSQDWDTLNKYSREYDAYLRGGEGTGREGKGLIGREQGWLLEDLQCGSEKNGGGVMDIHGRWVYHRTGGEVSLSLDMVYKSG